MHPIFITIGHFTIRTYGVIVAIAVITGIFVSMHYSNKFKLMDEDTFLDIVIWTIVGGILGARIFWILVSPGTSYYFIHPEHLFAIWEGGGSFEGAVLGGLITIFLLVKKYHISFWKFLDITAPGLAIGYGVGKFACFFNGCCYGLPVPKWWPHFFPLINVFTDPRSECDLLNTALFPAQLLDSLAGWITFFIIIFYVVKHRRYFGQMFIDFFYIFSPLLFAVEFVRYIPTHFLYLTPNQWVAIGAVIFALIAEHFLKKNLPIVDSEAQQPEEMREKKQG